MSGYRDFVRRFGPVMAAYVFAGCGIWLIGLIVVPQLLMIEKSLLYSDPAARAAVSQTKAATDRLFVEKSRVERKVRQLTKQLEEDSGAEGDQKDSGGGGLSLFDPFAQQQQGGAQDKESIQAEIDQLTERIGAIEQQVVENDAYVAKMQERAEPSYSINNYIELFSNDANRPIFWKTIWASILVTLVALVICYPIAYYLAKAAPKETTALLMLALIIPYWVNEILRTFAWLMILSEQGVLNQFFLWLGLIDTPVPWRAGNLAVVIGMTYAYILFMVFPIYNTIETLDRNQLEAARDLGAPTWRIHWRIVIPHAKPGIAVGCIMTFMLAAGSYAVPVMLGSTTSKWFTEVIYDQFYEGGDWGLGSAYAFVLLLTCLVFIMAMMRMFRVSLQDIAK